MRRLFVGMLTISMLVIPAVAHGEQIASPILQNPIACPDLGCVFISVLKIFLAALAVFGTFMFMYGGFLFLSSGGNEERIKKGKETLTWASLGIITILGSWVVIRFILESTVGVTR